MGLWDTYQDMIKQATAETTVSEEEIERVNAIRGKVAEAQELLKTANVTEYTDEDLAQVTTALIDKAITDEENMEKAAELFDYGKIMADGIYARLQERSAKEK